MGGGGGGGGGGEGGTLFVYAQQLAALAASATPLVWTWLLSKLQPNGSIVGSPFQLLQHLNNYY